MKLKFLILVIILVLWSLLILLTYTPLHLELAERLSLQRLGVYPLPDGDGGIKMVEGLPYVSQPMVLIQYMLIILVIAVLFFYLNAIISNTLMKILKDLKAFKL